MLTTAFLGMTLPVIVLRYFVAAGLDRPWNLLPGATSAPAMGPYEGRLPETWTVWSFLMASAHGAGLMLFPVLLGINTVEAHGPMAGHNHLSPTASPLAAMLATSVHTVAYLAVTGLLAWVVYPKLGLALLRKAWLNFDSVWAAALVLATGLYHPLEIVCCVLFFFYSL